MRSDLFMEVNVCLDKLGLKWDKMAGVSTDGYPSLTGEKCLAFEADAR